MKYAIKVNEVKKNGNVKGFATVVFGDLSKITNIVIVENKDKGQLFVSMPRYKSNERSEDGSAIYKDVCNPITVEFREELYSNIREEYERVQAQGKRSLWRCLPIRQSRKTRMARISIRTSAIP